jgi:hypothetical protein
METAGSTTASRVQPNAFGCLTVPFLLIALVPLGWGARAQWTKGALLRSGEAVPGTVVELRYVASNPSATRAGGQRSGKRSGQCAVTAFATRAGERRTVVSSVNRYPEPWKQGDVVDVVYDPADPASADLRTELEGWRLWFAIWCAVALLPLAIASAPVVLWLRERR